MLFKVRYCTTDNMREAFFRASRERYTIMLKRREGRPPPWTDDTTFANNRFCNVFREDDRVTVWFRENMRSKPAFNSCPADVLMTTVAFRWFNKPEMGVLLTDPNVGLCNFGFNGVELEILAKEAYPKGPYVTGAYIVKTPNGMKKLEGVIWCIQQVAAKAVETAAAIKANGTLEGAWTILREFPYLGDFMSYEVVTDLRHTSLLPNPSDVTSWANPGPGCARGLSRILYANQPERLNRGSKVDRVIMQEEMDVLLKMSQDNAHWPSTWPQWEMREVEHGLCEFDKYHRVCEGGRMKQRFSAKESFDAGR